ncbi:MAG: excinuclease ABC subunit UvrC [Candidatus Syntrophoarchaeum sp.]|nr:excinuclease ABC subunit UvrC [Candidatus Syntrophoarchaeum sp.]
MNTPPSNLPDHPGVYLFKDVNEKILYIGKAGSIKKRVSTYFRKSENLPDKIRLMLKHVKSLDFILTATEKEALILEATLIKRHKPRYNTQLTDDKSYPYIRVSDDSYPSISIVRRTDEEGAYYGPFTDLRSMKQVFKLLRRIFKLRTCKRMRKDGCLNREMDLCLAPCVNDIDPELYRKKVRSVVSILEGRIEDVIGELEILMWDLSSRMKFEEAATVRDQIEELRSVFEDLKTTGRGEDLDVIGLKSIKEGVISLLLFMVRDGRIVGRERFLLSEVEDIDASLTSLISQYYLTSSVIPHRIIVPRIPLEKEVLEEWLSEKALRSVVISLPEKEKELKLLNLAEKCAAFTVPLKTPDSSLVYDFKSELYLEHEIDRIEAFDVSNIGGLYAVGSMVVFEGGKAKKSDYRRFKIKTVEGIDDVGMMEEVLGRRLKNDSLPIPDLIMVDGGRGQLNAALRVIDEVGYDILAIGLAKRFEEIYISDRKGPIRLKSTSPTLKLLKQIRDEAHRFAIQYHRELRDKEIEASLLDRIDGIGKQRKTALLKHFGSIDAIRSASLDEIREVSGFGDKTAQKVYDAIH